MVGEEWVVGLAKNNPSEPDFPFYGKEDLCEKKCCVLNYAKIQIVERRNTTRDPRKHVNDELHGENHVKETILKCKDKFQIMMIWKWPLFQIVYHG